MEMVLNNGFCEMTSNESLGIEGGANLNTIAEGFKIVCGTVTGVCLLAGSAATTAAVSTIAAPVVLIGVAGGAVGGAIMAIGFNQ